MTSFTKEQIATALSSKAAHLTPDDVRRVSKSGPAVLEMIDEFPPEWEKTRKQARLLFDLIEASATGKLHIHPDDLRWAAGALIYLGAPLDLIPDHEEGGYEDDAEVIGLAIQKSAEQVRIYCQANGLPPAEYLS